MNSPAVFAIRVDAQEAIFKIIGIIKDGGRPRQTLVHDQKLAALITVSDLFNAQLRVQGIDRRIAQQGLKAFDRVQKELGLLLVFDIGQILHGHKIGDGRIVLIKRVEIIEDGLLLCCGVKAGIKIGV